MLRIAVMKYKINCVQRQKPYGIQYNIQNYVLYKTTFFAVQHQNYNCETDNTLNIAKACLFNTITQNFRTSRTL